MKPYIEVISRQQAERLTNEDITEKTVIVSISSVGDKKPNIIEIENIVDILYLHFDDTDHNAPEAISYNQAKKITEFINKYKNDVDRMIFHCDAGVSRSAGCAAATMKYLFGSDEPIFNNRKYCPNLRCYRLVLNAFYDFC